MIYFSFQIQVTSSSLAHPSGLVTLNVLPDQLDQELLTARKRADEALKSDEKRKETPIISPPILFDEDEEDDIIDIAEDSDGPAEVSDSDISDEDLMKPESDSSTLSDDFVIKKKKLKKKSLSLSLGKKKDHSTEDKIKVCIATYLNCSTNIRSFL